MSVMAAVISIWLAAHANYGGHHDVYLMLGSFLGVLRDGAYAPSRFTGYPVAEIGVGASAWAGGSSLSNLVNYGLFLGSVLLFPLCFQRKIEPERYLAFSAISLSSTVMAFDNIMSIDYPWSLFFWVLGCVCLRHSRDRMLALIPFALSIGSRPIFAVFVVVSILLVDAELKDTSARLWQRVQTRWQAIAATIFCGGLFYLPAWFQDHFGLSWISAVGPDNQGLWGLIARFVYKLVLALGITQTAVVVALLILLTIRRRKRQIPATNMNQVESRFLLTVALINLLIFARMPVQLSYLQPFLLCVGYAISQLNIARAAWVACLMAGLNLYNWVQQPKVLTVQYESDRPCSKVVAKGARIGLQLGSGKIEEFIQGSKSSACFGKWFTNVDGSDYSKAIVSGQPLRQVK